MSASAQQELDPTRLAELVSSYASDVKALDIVELDLRGVLGYTDYSSSPQVARTARRRRSTTASTRT